MSDIEWGLILLYCAWYGWMISGDDDDEFYA